MSTSSERNWRVIIVVGVVALVAVAIVFFALRGCEPTGDDDDEETSGEPPPGYRPGTGGVSPLGDSKVGSVPSADPPGPAKKLFDGPTRRASGPMRFVARYGRSRRRPDAGARTEEEARQLAESVRQRLLDGEDPMLLIRDLSDPPVGIPSDVLDTGAALGPGEASAVLDLRDGFVVFFNPSESE